ncbi:hypothetical protein FBU30_009266 [Linnemannia zychae]|nr:hypothetical protein FBU30_009266 [Linnemannia zychae]
MLVVRALHKLVDTFSNVRDETEPYDPTNEDDNTELTESNAIPVSGDSTGTTADSVDELWGFPAQVPSSETSEDSDVSSAVFLKAEPTTGTPLEIIIHDPINEDGNTELAETEAVFASGYSSGTFAEAVHELEVYSAQVPSAESGEDLDAAVVDFLKAELNDSV